MLIYFPFFFVTLGKRAVGCCGDLSCQRQQGRNPIVFYELPWLISQMEFPTLTAVLTSECPTLGVINLAILKFTSLTTAVWKRTDSLNVLHAVLIVLLDWRCIFSALHVTFGTMRLRVRKASQQRSTTPSARTTKTKRKHSEVEHSPPSEDSKMQKRDTGIFSTIKRFIRGNAVKVRSVLWLSLVPGMDLRSLISAVFLNVRWISALPLRGAVWTVIRTVIWSHPLRLVEICPAEPTPELAGKALSMEVSCSFVEAVF